ncbi:NADPH-dependent FMN reductase [Myceligenerans indicum]|uniref:NAD(P)H-dependent oxidoreductase n=1 Tax=Myceligenerans indicum TaxID=2593663 RepID=A0ABS1LHY7_9MICO|nr:NAD(P)H-dependent oxidoreductase [Myceligenerans indicum]MBL0885669.1 NAD(P)H-dependent oxidoreductase [Myceligenerans indicum]
MTTPTTRTGPLHDADPLRIVLLVASVRSPRMADPLLAWLREELAGADGIELDVVDLATTDLPMTGLGVPGGAPSPIADRLNRADGFLILTPEYNHSYPAALKNAIDQHLEPWARKPVAFVAYGAHTGGSRAVEHLRTVFPELRATTVREALLLNQPWQRLTAEGRFRPSDAALAVWRDLLGELRWWASALRTARAQDRLVAA